MKTSNTAERLQYIMRERNYRQVDILEKCKPYCDRYNVKLGRSYLCQCIQGAFEPKQDKLHILSQALGVSEAWLMGFDVPMNGEAIEVNTDYASLPIIGSVAAGIPLEECQDIDGYVEVSGETDGTFALRVHGDSMEPELHDRDVVIIKRQASYKNNDIVVARVNGYEYTVKKFRRKDTDIVLVPINHDFDPMVYPENAVAIEGRVMEVRRTY